jgi:AraC-like DNA-binding protein
MRQIVRKERPIVHPETIASRCASMLSGAASLTAWRVSFEWFEWTLKCAIGFVVPIDASIEACVSGAVSTVQPGEMLIVHRSNAETFRVRLLCERGSTCLAKALAVQMSMHAVCDAFAKEPRCASVVVKLARREEARVLTLAKLLAEEVDEQASPPTTLTSHLEKALYASLIEVLCTDDPLGLGRVMAVADARLACAVRAMAADPGHPWRLDTLAREAALSRTLFATRFKLELGVTPLEYLTRLRLQRAATLREESPHLSLHDIARSVGYADESALRRAQQRSGQAKIRPRSN